jgi:diguanylate cyclase (GGDEF)-like protein
VKTDAAAAQVANELGVRTRLHQLFAGQTPTPSPHTIAYSGAFLYGSGATLVLISLVVERDPSTRVALALASLALAYGVTAVLLAYPSVLPIPVYPYLTALGTLLISVLAYADGTTGSAYSLLYVWVALYSFYFYSLRVALAETLWVSVAAAVELSVRGGAQAPFSLWLLTTGTSLIGGLAIRQLVTQVRRLADRDDLTGLYSRRRLYEELDRDMHRAARTGEPLSLVMIDLDDFKAFNDASGHLAGDRHLKEAARRWGAELRATDLLARFGGEEFIVLMPNASIEKAVLVADRLRGATPNGQTASAGAVRWEPGEDALGLIARADAALYEAKQAGRDRTVVQLSAGPAAGRPAAPHPG